ncbi:hypothetical protein PHYPSEUDO_013828 [Phytophthora pseudosyringae]|uniref:Elicitin n=1 Tax=Phytophthora pseudosyringae TaxID=221518 RepID=A0A8T1W301_9STRA|nr:hypothetical protein PHYPSEUDO_013828 [Phytophthora pseudosyringae]
MNMQAIFSVLVIALAGSTSASSSSSGDTCSTSQQSSAYVTLASLLSLSSFTGCTTDSGYSLMYSTSLPTTAEYVMCASSNCTSLIKSVISLNPPDCTITVPTSGLKLNVYDLANGFSSKCSSLSSCSSSSATTTPSTTTATPTATTNSSTAPTATPTSTMTTAC